MTWWLALGYPTAALALAASLAGILMPETYANETPNWAGQAIGQDVANILAFVALLPLTELSRRGSLRAHLCWVGVMAYGVYAYAIYAFAVHFGPLFLAYTAVLGMSVYGLAGALGSVDANRVREAFDSRTPRRSAAAALVIVGALFALLWLSEIIPATLANSTPQSLETAGLASNPVYVLDLALLLPAALVGGVLLLRDRPWGYVLAPLLLMVLGLLSIGIVAGFVVLAQRGEEVPPVVGAIIGVIALVQFAILARFVAGVRAGASRPAVPHSWSRSLSG